MNKCLILLYFFFLPTYYINAQTISDQSTAEDCINFLNKKLKSAIGLLSIENPNEAIENVLFNGNSYSIFRMLGTKSTYSPINWANLIATNFSADSDGTYRGKWIFKKNNGPIAQLKIMDDDNATTHAIILSKKQDTVIFRIPAAESKSLDDIERASKRLSEIIQAKGDYLNANAFKSIVIEGKPTFEQTLEFIRNNTPRSLTYHSRNEKDVFTSRSINISSTLDLLAGTDTLVISIVEERERYDISLKRITSWFYSYYLFSMKDIESITPYTNSSYNPIIRFDEATKESNFPFGIIFKTASGNALIRQHTFFEGEGRTSYISSMGVPIGGFLKTENIDAVSQRVENSQLFKAFNHLRKLCGAPDPLQF